MKEKRKKLLEIKCYRDLFKKFNRLTNFFEKNESLIYDTQREWFFDTQFNREYLMSEEILKYCHDSLDYLNEIESYLSPLQYSLNQLKYYADAVAEGNDER